MSGSKKGPTGIPKTHVPRPVQQDRPALAQRMYFYASQFGDAAKALRFWEMPVFHVSVTLRKIQRHQGNKSSN